MKLPITLIICIISFAVGYGQIASNELYPSNTPTDRDTIRSNFTVIMPWAGAGKKSSSLALNNDSIIYASCYFTGMGGQGEEYLNDTVHILPLSSGIYHYRIVVNRSIFPSDTLCVDSNVQTRIYDTLLIVSAYTGISQASPAQWQAVLLGVNALQLYTPSAATASISVYDATGKAYYQGLYTTIAGTNNVLLDIPNQAAGLYIYHIQIGDQRRVLKFVKQ